MYFRVRVSLGEHPGALARLAGRIGEAELNILGLQVFPDLGQVTDELVVSAPPHWTAAAVAGLVSGAGGDEVSVEPCATHDLLDQPTRWLNAAQDVVTDPALLPVLLAQLLGPDPASWSASEHARAAALSALAGAVDHRPVPHALSEVEYDETGAGVRALLGGHVVGAASSEGQELTVQVAPAWRRLGIGTGLLTRALAKAGASGSAEVVLVAPADDEGTVPMVCSAGLRAPMRVSGGRLQVRITVGERAGAAR